PGFLVPDVPVAYGGYRPRNFDGSFRGLVTLNDALARSLNLPFVNLLGQTGVESFLGELGEMGVSARPAPYGLSLTVGGIELTPLELGGLYATLAENGHYRPLRLFSNEVAGGAPDTPPTSTPAADISVFGPGAAYLTRQALSLRDRPD